MPPKKAKKPAARAAKNTKVTVLPAETVKEGYFGTIEVNVLNLESKLAKGIFTLIIVYAHNFVGKISKIIIDDNGKCIINRRFFLYIKALDNYMMDALLSTPFFFSLIEGENKVDPKMFSLYGVGAAIQTNVVGQGNLGIMPLLTGQNEMEARVVLEPPGMQETIFFKRKYSEHPRINVKLIDIRKNLSAKELHNIMWLSVESVYNLDPSHYLEDSEHTLVFPMPSTSIDEEQAMLEDMFAVGEEPVVEDIKSESKRAVGKKTKPKSKNPRQQLNRPSVEQPPQKVNIKRPPDFDLIQFDRGIYKSEQTVDIRKKWASLASINGAPAMTEQRIRTDSEDLLSTIAVDINKKFRSKCEPRLEWNMVRPVWLHVDLENLFRERIMQYGVWPFELLMLGKFFLRPDQLSGNLKAKIAGDKKMVKNLKTEIDDIFSQFRELIEMLNKTGKEKEQVDLAKKLAELELRMQELLVTYEPNRKGNLLVHMPFIEKLRSKKKSRRHKDDGSASQADSGSDTTEGPKEFLHQDDIVVLERRAYIAWIDLTPLLVPGCTHLRTAGVLQYFNREEAVAKWGLTTTFSGDPDELCTKDKEISRLLKKDPTDINKIYMDLKKSELIKGSTNILLLLGRLLELSYNIKKTEREKAPAPAPAPVASPVVSGGEEKKKVKTLKFQEDKKKSKHGKRSKNDGGISAEKVTNIKKIGSKSGQLKTDSTSVHDIVRSDDDKQKINWQKMKAFDVKDILKLSSKETKKKSPKVPKVPKSVSSTISEEHLANEGTLKEKTMKHYSNKRGSHSQNMFAVYKCETAPVGKCIKPTKKNPIPENISPVHTGSVELLSKEHQGNEESSAKGSLSDQKKLLILQPDSQFNTKNKLDINQATDQSSNELGGPGIKSVSSISKKFSSDIEASMRTLSLGLSEISGEEPLLELFKSLLHSLVRKYEKLKDRYKVLKKSKAKEGVSMMYTSDHETISSPTISDFDEETTDEYLSSDDETDIKKVEPRHKMWHIGQNLDDEVMENQIGYNNEVRKMAVLEREFLLLKRLRLAQMKTSWEEKMKDIIPEYFENKKGEKVVVIIDIKLLKPLVPKPTLEEIDMDIKEYVKGINTKANSVFSVHDTFDEFHDCITTLSNLITSEYQDYKKSYATMMDPLAGETGNEFYEYLEKSRAHQIIAESLSEGMKGYLATALRDPIPTADKNDQKKLRYYVGWLYSRVVEEMQIVVNQTIIEGDHSLPATNVGNLPNISSHDLYLFAVEAIEEMDYERAKYYLSKRLEGIKKTEPLRWVEYAVIALRIGDYQQAMECIKEALILDSRCKEGLILYAVLLMTEGKFEDAQLFFNALISFYPMFIEGWMAFHMFYLIIENKTGADITLVAGTKISHDFKLPEPMKPPQLSWDNTTWIDDQPGNYISTAIYFLSFNLYEYAEVCLAQELERVGSKTLTWVYYLSVCHYIQGRYEDSAKHLSKVIAEVNDYNMDPRIWILLGHNCWMMGLKKCAVQMYLQSFTTKNNHFYEHMTFIRCGFFFIENEQAKFAKQMFLRAVRQQGTPMGWLGLGIALFMEGKLEDAELALKEANMLDTTLATAWGYLALISLYKLKEDQFLHCFREAKRYGLDDEKLALEIETVSQQIASFNKSRQLHFGRGSESLV